LLTTKTNQKPRFKRKEKLSFSYLFHRSSFRGWKNA